MPVILDKKLYAQAIARADQIYKKSSAYRSGYIVKLYKELGGRYASDHKIKPLARWFKEKWQDIGHREYPVYRPMIRVTKKTPLTYDEIDKRQLKKQIALKQIIKGNKNLPKFKPSTAQHSTARATHVRQKIKNKK
jgi:hypothetical protein